jgi:hypothetical protein
MADEGVTGDTMSSYPYDVDKQRGGNSRELLKTCYKLSFELMGTYEPFGQASSTYEDTGYPEMTALGIRTFLSVPENIQMMCDIGKETLRNIQTLGCVAEQDKEFGTPHDNEKFIKIWDGVIADLKKVCRRTYDAVMKGVKAHIKGVEKKKQ